MRASVLSWASLALLVSPALARHVPRQDPAVPPVDPAVPVDPESPVPPPPAETVAVLPPVESAAPTAYGTNNIFTTGTNGGNTTSTLAPIACGDKAFIAGQGGLEPVTEMILPYGGSSDSPAVVNITLTTALPGVLLEDVDLLTEVSCTFDSVRMTFADAATLALAHTTWLELPEVLLVTNHQGECDPEFERGYYISTGFEVIDAELTLVAATSKKILSDVASFMHADFAGIPTRGPTPPLPPSKRDIEIDRDVTVEADFVFGPVTLYEFQNVVTLTATKATANVTINLAGYLDFDIWRRKFDALYVDIDARADATLQLDLEASAEYANSFVFDVGYDYHIVNVPGVMTFGPEISLAVGADLEMAASVSAGLDLGVTLPGSKLHLDLIGDTTEAKDWIQPEYHADLTLNGEASVGITPFVSVTVEIDFNILDGLLDLTTGITPKVKFPTSAKLDVTQVVEPVNGTVVIGPPAEDGTCKNGVKVDSGFEFTLNAFVTQFWEKIVYTHTVPFVEECYSWV